MTGPALPSRYSRNSQDFLQGLNVELCVSAAILDQGHGLAWQPCLLQQSFGELYFLAAGYPNECLVTAFLQNLMDT
jgi:hypothetical protein